MTSRSFPIVMMMMMGMVLLGVLLCWPVNEKMFHYTPIEG